MMRRFSSGAHQVSHAFRSHSLCDPDQVGPRIVAFAQGWGSPQAGMRTPYE